MTARVITNVFAQSTLIKHSKNSRQYPAAVESIVFNQCLLASNEHSITQKEIDMFIIFANNFLSSLSGVSEIKLPFCMPVIKPQHEELF